MNTTPKQRTLVRSAVGLATVTSVPVRVIDGRLAPRLVGRRGGHFTRGGTPIRYPNAYARRGRSNMIYRTSTRRIYVGSQWLAEQSA